MTVVNPKSISGITSITTASGADDLLTFHTNNGTERFRVTSSGTVGVNCTPTAAPLEVKQLSTNGGVLRLRDSDAQYRYLEFDVTGATSTITARSNNSHGNINIGTLSQFGRNTAIYVKGTSGPLVGIGTSSPEYLLDVAADSGKSNLQIRTAGTGANDDVFLRMKVGGTGQDCFIDFGDDDDADVGAIRYNHSNNFLAIHTNAAEKLRITSDGKFGFGTDSPSNKIHILAGGGEGVIELQRSSANTTGNVGAINFTASDGHSVASMGAYGGGDNESAYINFKTTTAASANSPFTSTTERLRIGSAGQIGIGGANYGTTGQAIVSKGSASAVEWKGTNYPAFCVLQTSEQSIDTSSWVVLSFNSERLDSGGNFASNTFTVPAGYGGSYQFSVQAGIDDIQDNDYVRVGVLINDATLPVSGNVSEYNRAGAANQLSGASWTGIVVLSDGDTVKAAVYHNEGTTENTEPNLCFFTGFRLSL